MLNLCSYIYIYMGFFFSSLTWRYFHSDVCVRTGEQSAGFSETLSCDGSLYKASWPGGGATGSHSCYEHFFTQFAFFLLMLRNVLCVFRVTRGVLTVWSGMRKESKCLWVSVRFIWSCVSLHKSSHFVFLSVCWRQVQMISTPSSGIPSDTKSSSLCTRDTPQTSSQSSFSLTRTTGSWSRGPRTLRCTSTTWRRKRPSTCSRSTPTASNASLRLPCGPTSSGARQRTGSFGESVVCFAWGVGPVQMLRWSQRAEHTPTTKLSVLLSSVLSV